MTPLGPGSLTWKYFGDWRGMLQGPFAGTMQNMHPQLGAAVTDFSSFAEEPWQRVLRSLYPIAGVVFDGERAPGTGAEVRDYHVDIKGVDDQGRRYHALNPEVFYWAHSTFFVGTLIVADKLSGGLTEDEKRRLFDEHVQWYRLYGMSMRPVPGSWEDFLAYWDRMCREVLEDNKATRDVLDLSHLGRPPFLRWVPASVWAVLRPPVTRGFVWLTNGLYDPPVRELLGYPFSRREQRLHRIIGRSIGLGEKLVPRRYRYHPRARAGWDRARGRVPSDAPVVHTPDRNLPPVHLRDSPMHYTGAHEPAGTS